MFGQIVDIVMYNYVHVHVFIIIYIQYNIMCESTLVLNELQNTNQVYSHHTLL